MHTSPFIGCDGVNTVLDFLTIVLQFYGWEIRILKRKKVLNLTSVKGEFFGWRKLSPLIDFLLINDDSCHPLTIGRRDFVCWFSFSAIPSVLPLRKIFLKIWTLFFTRK